MEKYKDIVFYNLNTSGTPKLLVQKTKKRIRTRTLLKSSGITKVDFLTWNPDLKKALRRNYRLPKHFTYYKPLPENLAYIESIEE